MHALAVKSPNGTSIFDLPGGARAPHSSDPWMGRANPGGTAMTSDVSQAGRVHELQPPPATQAAAVPSGDFAKVYELEAARMERERDELPADVLSQMEAASRVYDELQAGGRELRFELHPGERVRADLQTLDGEVIRHVSLAEVLTIATPRPPGVA
jgi:hypothetical protein